MFLWMSLVEVVDDGPRRIGAGAVDHHANLLKRTGVIHGVVVLVGDRTRTPC